MKGEKKNEHLFNRRSNASDFFSLSIILFIGERIGKNEYLPTKN